MIRSTLFSLFLMAPISPVFASEEGCSQFISTSTSILGDFSPEEAWRQAGLDPKQISIKIENGPNGDRLDINESFELHLKYRGRKIGVLDLYQLPGGNRWGTYSAIQRAKGKGIGALMYLIGAETLFRLYPSAESLDSWDGSHYANNMWEKLVRNGHASKTPQDDEVRQYYQIERKHIGPKLKAYVEKLTTTNAGERRLLVRSGLKKKI